MNIGTDISDAQILHDLMVQRAQTLHALRATRNKLTTEMDDAKRLFELDHADTVNALKTVKDEEHAYEEQLRDILISAYTLTGGDKHFPAGDIRTEKEVVVTDPAQALAWAIQHGVCLALDTKAITALARSGATIDGVEVHSVTKATIKTDLSQV